MYSLWQYPFFVLHDLAALTCMTVVLGAVRGFPEKSRRRSIVVYAVSLTLAVINIALLPRVIERTDFDTGFLVFGGVSLLSVIVFPQVILRSFRHFSSALICLALNVGMEGLFSVFGYLFENMNGYQYHFYETLFCSAGYALISLFFISASKKKDLNIIRSTVDLIPKWLYVIIIICSFYSFFSVMGEAPELYRFERVAGILRALSVIGVILFAGYFVLMVFSLMAKQNQVLAQLNAQQLNYERMLQSDEQLRQFRHDYKNHMIVVTSLLNAGLTDEAAVYLEKIRGSSGVNENRFLTGNIVVDAILNNKRALAEDDDIELIFSGVVPETGIEHTDLCTVVGNLLDNAIEGTRAYPGERYIRFGSVVRSGFLTLSAVNPVEKRVVIKNNRIRTTKADVGNHGIGLKNVAAIAKKYHGKLLLSCDEQQFTADVTMRLTENANKTEED